MHMMPITIALVDDLAQSVVAMSSLEVFKNFTSQWKDLLSTLGVGDPLDDKMITFDINKSKHLIPPFISFQIIVNIKNIIIHQCIIDEGESTCMMYT
jgi:hypothetical protein